MKTIIDRNGKHWDVAEVGSHGIGARGEGQRLPEPISFTIVFKSDDNKVIKTSNKAIDKMTEYDLLELLEEQ